MATSERDLAAALFDASHVGEAAGIVLGRAADLVVASGQGLIAMRRTPQKVCWCDVGARVMRCPPTPPHLFLRSLTLLRGPLHVSLWTRLLRTGAHIVAAYASHHRAMQARCAPSPRTYLIVPIPLPQVTALLTMIGALTPVLADLEPALGNAAFAHILAKLRDLDEALQMEARASFDEFVAGIAMVDTWKRGSVESSVRPVCAQGAEQDRRPHAQRPAASAEQTGGAAMAGPGHNHVCTRNLRFSACGETDLPSVRRADFSLFMAFPRIQDMSALMATELRT